MLSETTIKSARAGCGERDARSARYRGVRSGFCFNTTTLGARTGSPRMPNIVRAQRGRERSTRAQGVACEEPRFHVSCSKPLCVTFVASPAADAWRKTPAMIRSKFLALAHCVCDQNKICPMSGVEPALSWVTPNQCSFFTPNCCLHRTGQITTVSGSVLSKASHIRPLAWYGCHVDDLNAKDVNDDAKDRVQDDPAQHQGTDRVTYSSERAV